MAGIISFPFDDTDDEMIGSSFDYFKLRKDFEKTVKKMSLRAGSVIKSKVSFFTWTLDPTTPNDFDKDLLFTIVDIRISENEQVFVCLQDNKLIEIDSFIFFLNPDTFNMDMAHSIKDTFSLYFEKIL
jgi:hypothetical protein